MRARSLVPCARESAETGGRKPHLPATLEKGAAGVRKKEKEKWGLGGGEEGGEEGVPRAGVGVGEVEWRWGKSLMVL